MPETALSRLNRLIGLEQYRPALKLAASWHDLGEHRDTIQRGWAASTHPEFYRELGKDPDSLIVAGVAAIRERYGL